VSCKAKAKANNTALTYLSTWFCSSTDTGCADTFPTLFANKLNTSANSYRSIRHIQYHVGGLLGV